MPLKSDPVISPQDFATRILPTIPIISVQDLKPIKPTDSYESTKKNKPVIFDFNNQAADSPSSSKIVLIWLPGAQQNPDNEIIRRFAISYFNDVVVVSNASHQQHHYKIDLIHCTTYAQAENTVRYYLHHQDRFTTFVGGHSLGSGIAGRLTVMFPEMNHPTSTSFFSKNKENSEEGKGQQQRRKCRIPCILFGTGPASFGAETYGLCVLGELDGDGKRYVGGRNNNKKSTSNNICSTFVPLNGEFSGLLVPHGADHSLRIPDPGQNKEQSCMSAGTKKITSEIVKYCHNFVVSFCLGRKMSESEFA